MSQYHRPFVITAKTMGIPKRLFTRLLVANPRSEYKLSAAYVNALWDTGAETCVMSASLAKRLGFDFCHSIPAKGIGLPAFGAVCGYAYVSLVSNGDLVETVTAVVNEEVGDDYSFIIGMDFISKGSFALSCSAIETTMSFTMPPAQPIDFTKTADSDTTVNVLPLCKTIPEPTAVYHGAEVAMLINP